MIGYLRRLALRHLVSPYGIALIATCHFLFAWLLPASLYTRYLLEPDLLHHNLIVLLFFTLSVAAFLAGVRMIGTIAAPSPAQPKPELRSNAKLIYLTAPLFLAGIPCLIYVVLLAGNLNFVALLLSQHGDVVKQAITGGSASGYWGSTLFLLTGVLWWAAYRSAQLELKGNSKAIFRAVFLGCSVVDVITCLATFDRTNLMPLLAGITLIYLFFRTRSPRVRLARLAMTSFAFVAMILGTFVALQFARSATRFDSMVASILGYTVASYNRLAALMLGVAHYVYQGKGAYLVAFLTENERFHAIRQQMGLPNAYQIWLSEFPALQASGLNSAYNWASVFGYIYSDIGWWTPIFLFAIGLLAGFLWNRFRSGATFGIVLYPWMAFWILFWFGWNLLLDARGVVLIETSVLLLIYDKLSLAPLRRPAAALVRSSWEPALPSLDNRRAGLR